MRRNHLTKLRIDEAWATGESILKQKIVSAFKTLLTGLDGFTTAFWQLCWDIVKDEIMRMFREFYNSDKFVWSLNTTFLVMIPNKGDAMDLKDFRSISMVGSLYKLLAKVLANILKKVIGSLVNKDQNAFVRGRQILDASLIANEVVDSMVKKGKGILCKLDIEKAYDHLNWSFLLRS